MKRLIITTISAVIFLLAGHAMAWNVSANPNPSFISDTSHVLSDEAHTRLDARLQEINQSSANEIAALIEPTIDDQNIEDVAFKTAQAWGVGKAGLDNGVLVVIAMKEHRTRIEVGKGAEGDLPDLKASDILKNVMRPQMHQGNVEGALSDTFNAISSSIANHKADVAQSSVKASSVVPSDSDMQLGLSILVWLTLLTLVGITAIIIIKSRRQRINARLALEELERDRLADQVVASRLAYEAAARINENRQSDFHPINIPTNPVIPQHPIVPQHPSTVILETSTQDQVKQKKHTTYRAPEETYKAPKEESPTPIASTPFDFGGGGSNDGGSFGGGGFEGGGSSGSW